MSKVKRGASLAVFPILVLGGGTLMTWGVSNGFSRFACVFGVQAAVALCVLTLERLTPYETDWNESKADALADAAHYAVNHGIKQAVLMTYAVFVERYSLLADSWPFVAQVAVALVVIDFFLYWIHRISHSNDVLWAFHSVHHASRRLYWVNGERRHPIHQICEGLPGVTAVMLLGVSPEALAVALGVLGLNMMLQHGNVDYRAGILRYVFCVAENHRLHHHKNAERGRVNFGAFLLVWDFLFGSYAWSDERMTTETVGIESQPDYPTTYLTQLSAPFRMLWNRGR